MNEENTTKILAPVPKDTDRGKGPYKILESIYKVEKFLAMVIENSMVFLSLALALLMATQVFLRYVLKFPFLGIEEMAPLFAAWVYFLGMAFVTRKRDHMGGGILILVCKNHLLIKIIRLLGTVICLFVVCIFCFYASKMAIFNMGLGRLSTYMRLPKYLWDFSVVVGFVLTELYLVMQFFLEMFDLFYSTK